MGWYTSSRDYKTGLGNSEILHVIAFEKNKKNITSGTPTRDITPWGVLISLQGRFHVDTSAGNENNHRYVRRMIE